MSDVLRSTTFQLEFKGQDGITGIKQFTRAVSDADKTVEELSAALGDNVEVTYKNVQSTQELTAEARALVSQMERTNARVKEMTSLYQHQASMIGKTAQEQEVLNAVYRLGANATEAQKQQVTQLVQNYQLLRDGSDQTGGSFRNLRGISQQLGWQLQDVAVQAQLGTSAFVIFSQQGSQLAAAFGPTGALVGAVIAVAGAIGGALVNSMGVAGEEIDKLIGKVDSLGKATKELAAINITKKIKEQEKELKNLNAQIAFSNKYQEENGKLTGNGRASYLKMVSASEQLSDELKKNKEALDTINKSFTQNIKDTKEAEEATKKLLESYGLKTELLGKTDREQAKLNATTELGSAASKKQVEKVIEEIDTYYNKLDALKANEKAIKDAEKAEKAAAAESKRVSQQRERAFQAETLSLIKQTETTEEEYNRRKAIIDEYVKYEGTDKRTDQAYAALEQWRTDQLTKETDKQIREFERREKARRQIEKGQKKLIPGVDDETSRYEANIRILTQQNSQIEAETQRHITSLRQARDNGKMSETQYNLEVQQAQANELSEQQRINALKESEEERHTRAMEDLQIALYQAQLQSVASAAMVMSSTVDLMSTGIEDVKAKTAEMNAFQKTMFLISQSIAAASALINGISLGSKLAEMFPLAAPAMITFGTSLGAAQAGAIMGTTFAGTFDNGGVIPAGQSGIVAEYGDELVNGVMVKGPARVTSREETAAMMNNGGGSVSILIENKIDGATYREERIDENTVKIIAEKVFNQNIDSGVSSVLGNRNSKSTKQLKSNFSVKGKY